MIRFMAGEISFVGRRTTGEIVGLGLLACLLVGFAGCGESTAPPAARATPSPSPVSTIPATPTPESAEQPPRSTSTPPRTTPTPTPPTYDGPLEIGVWAQISGTGNCLNIQMGAGLLFGDRQADWPMPILNCLPDGFVGYIVDGPDRADGHWWWYLAGQGWAVDDWLQFHHEGGPPWPPRPQLTNAGQIAYVREDNVWLINADSSDNRRLTDHTPPDFEKEGGLSVSALAWSPSGDALAYTLHIWGGPDGAYQIVRIIDVEGQTMRELPNAIRTYWSPDSTRLSYLREVKDTEVTCMDAPAQPTVLDLRTDEAIAVAPVGCHQQPPRWSPDGTLLLDENRILRADGSGEEPFLDPEEARYYWRGTWSPDGSLIAFHTQMEHLCRGYVLYDPQKGQDVLCSELPPRGDFGGRGGHAEDAQTDWTPNGRYFLYHWEFGDGQNGVWAVEAATGETTLIPAAGAAFVSAAPDSQHIAFSTGDGYIWVVDINSTQPTMIAEGREPAWRPSPP